MSPPTDRPTLTQFAVLRFIHQERVRRGMSPTVREMGVRFGWASTNAVSDFIKALERKGLLRREPLHARSLQPTARGLQVIKEWEGL